MPRKFFVSLFLLHVAGSATLLAQSTNPLTTMRVQASFVASAVEDTVCNLTQCAFYALLGIVALAAAFFIYNVYKSGIDLKKSGTHTRTTQNPLLIAGIVVCSLGMGCTAAQRAQSETQPEVQAAESRGCPMNHHRYDSRGDTYANSNPHTWNSNWYNPIFCKRCGQRIQRNGF
jgi:hypothetical protein